MFVTFAGDSKLVPGLYKVIVPLFLTERPAMVELAKGATSWNIIVAGIERTRATGMLRLGWPPVGGGFKYRFPRTNRLNPATGLDSATGAEIARKGYYHAAGPYGVFW
ncbi:hypothetical protein GO986_21855 [Deinococcus sp. HMF7620]|uniref:Uncharacterized protein n=1 Tax=Deinococcus arboris TaxID=2682977 RepID=A0A7C9MTY9_9DEIO|nr:hypothetical protein [Deinococcus arboris]MVN89384.1 hypothetical protein [Deinococcus arboris]